MQHAAFAILNRIARYQSPFYYLLIAALAAAAGVAAVAARAFYYLLIAAEVFALSVFLSFSLSREKLAKQPHTLFSHIGGFWPFRRVNT